MCHCETILTVINFVCNQILKSFFFLIIVQEQNRTGIMLNWNRVGLGGYYNLFLYLMYCT
jgi:hypothetical protein